MLLSFLMIWVLLNVDLNNVSLDDDNFDNDDPATIAHIRIKTCSNRYKQRKVCKKDKQIINVIQHGIQQDRGIGACQKMKKRNRTIFDS